MSKFHLGAIVTAAVIAVAATAANAVTFGFERITSNNGVNQEANLFVDVTDGGSGTALFDFLVLNDAGTVTQIYFDADSSLISGVAGITQSGANFLLPPGGVGPGSLPAENNATPPFTTDIAVRRSSGNQAANGLTTGDSLSLSMQLGSSFADVLAALESGAVRVGLHVQAQAGGGNSDSYVSVPVPAPVPLPAAAWMLIAGMGALVSAGRLRKA